LNPVPITNLKQVNAGKKQIYWAEARVQ
jgi:hypothetical protein